MERNRHRDRCSGVFVPVAFYLRSLTRKNAMRKIGFWCALVGLGFLMIGPGHAEEERPFVQPTPDHPLIVKVVVLAMFEIGADTGDKPGEYQFWVERRK